MAATGGRGADLVLDSVGEVLFDPCLNSLARKGCMIHISAVGKEHVSFDLLDFYRRGLKLFGLNTSMLDAPGNAEVLRGLLPGFEEGTLRAPPIAGRYPLEAAAEAYARVGSGEAPGRLLMVPGSGRGR